MNKIHLSAVAVIAFILGLSLGKGMPVSVNITERDTEETTRPVTNIVLETAIENSPLCDDSADSVILFSCALARTAISKYDIDFGGNK